MWNFDDWVERTRSLQVESYGQDPGELEGEAFAEFIRWNCLALEDELHEMLQEIPWKPWSKTQGRPDEEHRHRAVTEIIDLMHFLGNIAVALHITGEELSEGYIGKMAVNARRQEEGYEATEHKCSNCHRDYEEAGGRVAGTRLCTTCFHNEDPRRGGDVDSGGRLSGSSGSVHTRN